ncbi:MAG: SDR family NAD(P)-dependent oxidoreductase, partial [Chloroflexi bacterium]|nr:SDR family NAD(P)-dependent oxidoreductase [Chloroflexota bacterium]
LVGRLSLPVWVQGGIGMHTAAACYAGGAAGVVLDSQVLLAKESGIDESLRAAIAMMDGSESVVVGEQIGERYRVYARAGSGVVSELRELDAALSGKPHAEALLEWRESLRERAARGIDDGGLAFLGQSAAFAGSLARRFVSVGGIVEGIRRGVKEHIDGAKELSALAEGSALAVSHGTRYPVVQGPMTRVSDRAEFALRVAEEGGLPFVALALMRGEQVKSLMRETRELLGDKPWGVGILGFVPQELRREQLDVIMQSPPPFALIAGGRPDQAKELESEGVATYLHVPSPGLLSLFADDGARRFVFEGRECGGHVGPRSSFVLWNTMVDVLLERISRERDGESYHVLFAGGVHDALSSSMVAALSAPLSALGVKVGVLMGTAYVFTDEAVSSGAITESYRQEAMHCEQTVLLETGPGHSTRVALTPYVDAFKSERLKLESEGLSAEEVKDALEDMNIGRLRIASKGITRNPEYVDGSEKPEFLELDESEQLEQGTFMLGQVASLRESACSISQLHADVCDGGAERLRSLDVVEDSQRPTSTPSSIAIVGMGAILPGASGVRQFWENILNKVDSVREVPRERWEWERYYDEDKKAKDKVYSKWGGFIDDVPFDPVSYGIPPSSLPSIEPVQLLTLEVVKAALKDAGYWEREFTRERTSVVLGAGGGVGDVGAGLIARSALPLLFGDSAAEIVSSLDGALPEWTEDAFPGILMNVASGRVSNRFDFGGMNCTIDAACASSLAAIDLGVKELECGNSDMVIAGGVDAIQNPFAFLAFSKSEALSPTGRCRPYDADADGIAISEGLAVIVMKRLEDAERDGDRIYAVIKGVGSSSDGRGAGLTAPRPEGQLSALRRAYDRAGLSPSEVGLIEGHGTGTVVGDRTEVMALSEFFAENEAARQGCALGSVKSMIGHTKCAAGVAGLIKASLALHHKVLPPTLGVSEPNPRANFAESPFYVNTEARPWVSEHLRHAGVSAFGFGGINFHIVLEEYADGYPASQAKAALQEWPAELFVWRASSRQRLAEKLAQVEDALSGGAMPSLRELSHSLWLDAKGEDGLCLSIIADSREDLLEKLGRARESLTDPDKAEIDDPRGIYFNEKQMGREGKIAFVFPGQGSQYVDMMRELAGQFDEVRECFERADSVLSGLMPKSVSGYVFPPPTFDEAAEKENQNALTETDVAQPALGAADMAMLHLLRRLGIDAEFMAGQSYGEFVALCAGGVISEDELFKVSEARGRFIVEESGEDSGTMAAVEGGRETVAALLAELEDGVVIANLNAPMQTVISGSKQGVDKAVERFKAEGMRAKRLPVACAFHSSLVAPAKERLADYLSAMNFSAPTAEVYSNTTGAPYPHEPGEIAALLADHLVKPTNFVEEIRGMYGAGARVFVEVGPRAVLSKLVGDILGDEPHLAVASDQSGRNGITQLLHMLGKLASHGVSVRLDRLYEGRDVRDVELEKLLSEDAHETLSPTTWLVNGGRAVPMNEAAKPKTTLPLRIEVVGNGTASRATKEEAIMRETPVVSQAEPSNGVEVAPQPVPQPAPVMAAQNGVDHVMTRFQGLMGRFLDTQKNVMLAYLNGGNGGAVYDYPPVVVEPAPPAIAPPMPATPEVVATPTPEPVVEPHPEQPVAVVEPQVEHTPLNEQALAQRLVEIVSERTGYPPEMIDPEADLEAELGIDSIKRVEIVGTLRQSIPELAGVDLETLSASKSLRAIIDSILQSVTQTQEETPHRPFERASGEEAVGRFTLRAVEIEALPERRLATSGRVIVVTDDEGGVADSLALSLKEQGQAVAMVRMGEEVKELDTCLYQADLTSDKQVAELVSLIERTQGPIGGLVHLLALKQGEAFEHMDMAMWRRRLGLELKSLFLLSRELSSQLAAAAQEGGAWLVGASGMGGSFGVDGAPMTSPSQGAMAGLVKSVAQEWPGVRVKAIDLNTQQPPDVLAGHILAEMSSEDSLVEVGYDGARRLAIEVTPTPLDTSKPPELEIGSDWVILVTGGARGITAEAAKELAERYRPTLLLVGRTPMPDSESQDTAGLDSPQELKAAIIEAIRRQGQTPLPAQVEAAYNRLLREREI